MKVLAERFGLSSDIVATGLQAMKAMQDKEYQLILMDWLMPEMDGLECSRRIRELEAPLGRHTPIIAVTAQDEDSIIRECLNNAMDGYLSKPFTVQQFEHMINQWITTGEIEPTREKGS